MYHMLTNIELSNLGDILFEGTEEAFRVASRGDLEPNSAECHLVTHREVAHLFIEAGTELVERLAPTP